MKKSKKISKYAEVKQFLISLGLTYESMEEEGAIFEANFGSLTLKRNGNMEANFSYCEDGCYTLKNASKEDVKMLVSLHERVEFNEFMRSPKEFLKAGFRAILSTLPED